YYITYSHNSYFYNEYFDGSERKQASAYKSLVSIIKRSNDLIGVVEQINDNKLVKTSLTYYKFNSDKSKVIESYGICIYMFKLNGFHLNHMDKELRMNWHEHLIYDIGSGGVPNYDVKQRLGLEGNLKISSLEYYYEGNVIIEKDSLGGRLKTILLKPDKFEIGFNKDRERKIYINPIEEKQPLSVSFYQSGNKLFVIFLSSENNKITENSIDKFIVFD